MHIALASNDRYFDGLALSIASILRNTKFKEKCFFHILHGNLSLKNQGRIQKIVKSSGISASINYYTVEESIFKGVRALQGNILTYARLLLPLLLPEQSEVIYGDVDILYGADLAPLWGQEITGKAAIVVRDSGITHLGMDCPWLPPNDTANELPYFNAGIMKINLNYWRTHDISKKAITIAQRDPEKCSCWDQTILNYLLKDNLVWSDSNFNFLASQKNQIDSHKESPHGKNIHYICSIKPWMRYSLLTTSRVWRKNYRQLVSINPAYTISLNFWLGYVWGDILVKSNFIRILCIFLVKTKIYKISSSLTLEKLKVHINGS